jgi:hypothetical protein
LTCSSRRWNFNEFFSHLRNFCFVFNNCFARILNFLWASVTELTCHLFHFMKNKKHGSKQNLWNISCNNKNCETFVLFQTNHVYQRRVTLAASSFFRHFVDLLQFYVGRRWRNRLFLKP